MSIPIQLPSQGPKNSQVEAFKKFFQKNQEKIILILGALLIVGLAFGAGRLSVNQKSVPIEKESNIKGEVKVPIKREIKKQSNNGKIDNELESLANESENIEVLEDESGYHEIDTNIEE